MSQKTWTKEDIQERLKTATAQATAPERTIKSSERLPSELEWAYREAAAVLSSFVAAELKPVGTASGDDSTVAALLNDCTPLATANEQRWMLHNSPRKAAIRRLGNRSALQAALAANEANSDDPVQQMISAYINDEAPPLQSQNLVQLRATLQIIDWFEGVLSSLPGASDVQEAYLWAELLQPFRYLVGNHFRGRNQELKTLREFVAGVPSAPGANSQARQGFLMVRGPGGMGKSTLLARFLLNQIDETHKIRTPFVYIDFDRPGILPEEPLTLLIEAARQLGIQVPGLRKEAEDIRQQWMQLTAADEKGPALKITSKGIQSANTRSGVDYAQRSLAQSTQDLSYFFDTFVYLWNRTRDVLIADQIASPRLVLILDTFEEVQYLSQDFVDSLLDFISELQNWLPDLRVIVAGRAPVEHHTLENTDQFAPVELLLDELDREAATGFLSAHGVDDEEVARRIVERVGGNPLSLRLAAEVLRKGESDPTELGAFDPRTEEVCITEGLIQGQLYRRILQHIHNRDVRKLAHPGLVLRRITPEIIQKVLAVPCKVVVDSPERARELFDELRREAALVYLAEDGSLHHRMDVRRIMLQSLQREVPARVYDIHARAVDYYKEQEGLTARAEEIYHRLQKGSRLSRIDERWQEGIEPYLRNAVEELPADKQPYLASRLGITSAEFQWDEADIEDWERHVETRVIDLTNLGRSEAALQLLAERRERTVKSPLYRLEAQILASLGRWREARQVANEGIYAASQAKEEEKLLDLFQVAAKANEMLGDYGRAQELLDAVEALEIELHEPDLSLLRLEVATQRLRLLRLGKLKVDEATVANLREQAIDLYEQFGKVLTRRRYEKLELLRDLAIEIGFDYPEVMTAAIQHFDLEALTDKQIECLTLVSRNLGLEASGIDLSQVPVPHDLDLSVPIRDLTQQRTRYLTTRNAWQNGMRNAPMTYKQ